MNNLIVINATDKNKCNCVKWARMFVPNLPFGLWTLWDKKKIINSKKAKKGYIAIINAGFWGHVAIVNQIHPNGRITIREANFKTCKITERTDKPQNLKIIGYFKP